MNIAAYNNERLRRQRRLSNLVRTYLGHQMFARNKLSRTSEEQQMLHTGTSVFQLSTKGGPPVIIVFRGRSD